MLLISGKSPVAQEYSFASSSGRAGSALLPVRPEWPMAMMPTGSPVVAAVVGFAVTCAVAAAVGSSSAVSSESPPQAAKAARATASAAAMSRWRVRAII